MLFAKEKIPSNLLSKDHTMVYFRQFRMFFWNCSLKEKNIEQFTEYSAWVIPQVVS